MDALAIVDASTGMPAASLSIAGDVKLAQREPLRVTNRCGSRISCVLLVSSPDDAGGCGACSLAATWSRTQRCRCGMNPWGSTPSSCRPLLTDTCNATVRAASARVVATLRALTDWAACCLVLQSPPRSTTSTRCGPQTLASDHRLHRPRRGHSMPQSLSMCQATWCSTCGDVGMGGVLACSQPTGCWWLQHHPSDFRNDQGCVDSVFVHPGGDLGHHSMGSHFLVRAEAGGVDSHHRHRRQRAQVLGASVESSTTVGCWFLSCDNTAGGVVNLDGTSVLQLLNEIVHILGLVRGSASELPQAPATPLQYVHVHHPGAQRAR